MSENSIISKFKSMYPLFDGDSNNAEDPTILLLKLLSTSEDIGNHYYNYYLSQEFDVKSFLLNKLFNYNLKLSIPYKFNVRLSMRLINEDVRKSIKLELPKYSILKSENSSFILMTPVVINSYSSTYEIELVQGILESQSINQKLLINSNNYRIPVDKSIYPNIGYIEIDGIKYFDYSIIDSKYNEDKLCYCVELQRDGNYYLILSKQLLNKVMNNSNIQLYYLVNDNNNSDYNLSNLSTDKLIDSYNGLSYEVEISKIMVMYRSRYQLYSTTRIDFDANISKSDYEVNINSLDSVILSKIYDCSDVISNSIIELSENNPDVKLRFEDQFTQSSWIVSNNNHTIKITFKDVISEQYEFELKFNSVTIASGQLSRGANELNINIFQSFDASSMELLINGYGYCFSESNNNSGILISNCIVPYYLYVVVASNDYSVQLKREIMNSIQNGLCIKELLSDYGTLHRDGYQVTVGNQGYVLHENYRPYQLPYIVDSKNSLMPINKNDIYNKSSRYNMPDVVVQFEPAVYIPVDITINLDISYDTIDELTNMYLSLMDDIRSLFELSKSNKNLEFNSKLSKLNIERLVYSYPNVNDAVVENFNYYRNSEIYENVDSVQFAPFELPVLGKLTISLRYHKIQNDSTFESLNALDTLKLTRIQLYKSDLVKTSDKPIRLILNLKDSMDISDKRLRNKSSGISMPALEITYWALLVNADSTSITSGNYVKSVIVTTNQYHPTLDNSEYHDDTIDRSSGLYTDNPSYRYDRFNY